MKVLHQASEYFTSYSMCSFQIACQYVATVVACVVHPIVQPPGHAAHSFL